MPTILPNAKNQFFDANGKPLSSGQVYFYIPNTSTPKATYQDPGQTIQNTNPVILDAAGEAIIWGSGTYRQVVYDANNNLIWDQITEDTSGGLLGNMTDDVFVAGTDFTPGTTAQLTLTAGPGSISNTWIYFDAAYQDDSQIASLSGTTLKFNAPIPIGVSKVTVKIGSTVAIGTPSNNSVTDATVAPNAAIQSTKLSYNQGSTGAVTRTVQARLRDAISLFDFGAVGDGVADDTAAIQAAINAAFATGRPLSLPGGNYKITATLNIGNGTSTSLSTLNGLCMRGISTGATAAEVGNPGSPVKFTWAGASGGTMMLIAGPIYGIDLFGFELDCAGIAGTGIHFSHPINSYFNQILIQQYTSIGYIHDAYSNMTGLAVGSQHNLFDDVTAKYPAPGGNGASFGMATSGSSPFLDVAQNVYRNCEWWRDGTSTVTYSLRLQFIDNCTFIDCETSALTANNGVGIYIVPPTGALGFPAACTFINSPIQGGVAAGASWVANEGLLFWPYPVGDGEPVPSTSTPKQLYGMTSKGDYFGGLSIGVGNTPILQHISKTFPIVFPAVAGQSSSIQAVAIAGSAPGDTVVVSWDEGPFPTGLVLSATVAVAGTVDIIWTNVTGGSVTPASGTYRVDVWKH